MQTNYYGLLADIVLVIHVSFVAFVVIGLLMTLLGGLAGWHWVRNPWFRLLHMGGIAIVVLQSWFGVICPLTTLEMNLREQAGQEAYSGSFIAHWLHSVLFFDLQPWVFVVGYTLFGLAVVGSWYFIRPRKIRRAM